MAIVSPKTSLLIGLIALASQMLVGCSSYEKSGRFARYAEGDIALHPDAKQDLETLLSSSNNDATERAVLCIHAVYEAEASTPPVEAPVSVVPAIAKPKIALEPKQASPRAKSVPLSFSEGARAESVDAKDPSSFSFTAPKADPGRACLKLCAPSPSEDASEEVRVIARKYSDRCRAHFGEIRTLEAD